MAEIYHLRKIASLLTYLIPIVLFSNHSHAMSLLSLISGDQYQKNLASACSQKLVNEKFDKSSVGKGIVIDLRDFESTEMSFAYNMIFKEKKPIFIYGSHLLPQNLFKQLRIFPRINSFRTEGVDKIQATGIFRRAIGSYYTINISSRRKIPFCELLSYIDAAVDRMLSIDAHYPINKKENGQQWENDGETHEEEIEDFSTMGLFRQSVGFWFSKNDNSKDSDWWYMRLSNEVIPGNNYMTTFNKNKAKGINAKGLPCWGPIDEVENFNKAKVEVGCPGPKEQWEWTTGWTRVEDKTLQNVHECAWEVRFLTGKKDSRIAHKWEPGAQFETRDKNYKELHVRMDLIVDWQDITGRVKTWIPESWTYEARTPY